MSTPGPYDPAVGDHPIPHRYGTADTLGAANEITAPKVEAAARLITRGLRYQLGQVLEASSPTQMWRYWKHSLLVDRAVPGRLPRAHPDPLPAYGPRLDPQRRENGHRTSRPSAWIGKTSR